MAKPPPTLNPTPLPQLVTVPGATGPVDCSPLRCPLCNKIVFIPKPYCAANHGATCSCPLCGGAVSLP